MKKILFLSFTISLLFFSCKIEECEGDCPKWTECGANSGDPLSFGNNGYDCQLINRIYYGYFNGTETIIDEDGNTTINQKNEMWSQPVSFPEPNYLYMRISSYNENIKELECIFNQPGSGFFNIPRQSIYDTTLATEIYYEGSGNFTKNESTNSYKFELNCSYEHSGSISQMNITAATNP
tara:strand:- start:127 stop:666 length:540 start_codon:yes stop_codon:yes gene_type:complete